MNRELQSAYRFHREHGGVRAAWALAAAKAEIAARNLGFRVMWEYDDDADIGDHKEWCPTARRALAERRPDGLMVCEYPVWYADQCDHEITVAVLYGPDSDMPLNSLGGIIDVDTNYRRVIEAELAREVLPSTIPASALYECLVP